MSKTVMSEQTEHMKIAYVYCRTLLSQSAASLTISSISGYMKSLNCSGDFHLVNRQDKTSCDRMVSNLLKWSPNVILAKINFQDWSILLPALVRLNSETESNVRIVICGPFAQNHFETIRISYPFIELLRGPEYEENFASLLHLSSNSKALQHCREQQELGYLDRIGMPDRTVESGEIRNLINIESSRGCAYACGFCHLADSKLMHRKVSLVVDEIVYLHDTYGKNFFIFNDSCLWSTPKDNDRLLTLADEIISRNLDIRFYAYLRLLPLIDEAVLFKLRQAGLVRVFVGIENISVDTQSLFNKPLSRERVSSALQMFESFGINYHIGYIVFEPYSTLESLKANIQYLYEINKIFRVGIILEKLRILPKTDLHLRLLADGLIDRDADYRNLTYGYRFEHSVVGRAHKILKHYCEKNNSDMFASFEYCCTTLSLLTALINFEQIQNHQIDQHVAKCAHLREDACSTAYDFFSYCLELANCEKNVDIMEQIEAKLEKLDTQVQYLNDEYRLLVDALSLDGHSHIPTMLYSGEEGL